MKTLTREDLKSLAAPQEQPCFSFYLNTAKAGKETLENPVRFRSLLRQAHDQLTRNGVRSTQVDQLLQPAVELLDDYPFWQDQDRGLAVFLADGKLQSHKLPYEVAPLVVNGNSFHLKPLLPLVAYDGAFFILALSKNAVKLFRASRYTIEDVTAQAAPPSEAEALQYDDPEKSLHAHTSQPVGRGEQAAIMHGQGAVKEDAKERTLRFFYYVNRSLRAYLNEEHAPLLLAGVEYYLPLYREANTYPHLIEDVIPGNPDERRPEELREAAWQKLEPLFKAARDKAAAAIAAGLPKQKATDDLETAVLAASHGRVDKCLVALNKYSWGAVDKQGAKVAKLTREDRGALDLLDFAAIQTVLHGGDVFPVSDEKQIPGAGDLAVLYRF